MLFRHKEKPPLALSPPGWCFPALSASPRRKGAPGPQSVMTIHWIFSLHRACNSFTKSDICSKLFFFAAEKQLPKHKLCMGTLALLLQRCEGPRGEAWGSFWSLAGHLQWCLCFLRLSAPYFGGFLFKSESLCLSRRSWLHSLLLTRPKSSQEDDTSLRECLTSQEEFGADSVTPALPAHPGRLRPAVVWLHSYITFVVCLHSAHTWKVICTARKCFKYRLWFSSVYLKLQVLCSPDSWIPSAEADGICTENTLLVISKLTSDVLHRAHGR